MLPSVMSGEVGGVELAMTWIRKTSEMERLSWYSRLRVSKDCSLIPDS